MNKFETLKWENNELILIDQRVLPTSEEYVVCKTVDDVATAIENMVVRGAPAIGCSAAFGFAIGVIEAIEKSKITNNCSVEHHKNFIKFFQLVNKSRARLARTRPTAVNLFWALSKMNDTLDLNIHLKSNELTSKIITKAKNIFYGDIEANQKIGNHGAGLLSKSSKILTHCNAGALATAGHGTALGIVRSAHNQGKKIEVFAGETRPFLQGARLTAWELLKDKIPVTLITDSMSGYLMSLNSIDAVIVGADRVTSNGDVINKIGTYSLAVLASQHNVPFYVACPFSTIDMKTVSGKEVIIEERDSKEVTGYKDNNWSPEGVTVFNPAFDVTPADLVTFLITENGVINPKELHSLEINS